MNIKIGDIIREPLWPRGYSFVIGSVNDDYFIGRLYFQTKEIRVDLFGKNHAWEIIGHKIIKSHLPDFL